MTSSPLSTERAFELYGEQELSMQLNITNLTNFDRKIIFSDVIRDANLFSNFKLKDLDKRLRIFFDEIRAISVKPHLLYVDIKKANDQDIVGASSKLDYNKIYVSPFIFPYLLKSNSFQAKLNYSLLNNRFDQAEGRLKEMESSLGYNYCFNTSKHSGFISNLNFINLSGKELELTSKYAYSTSEQDFKRKQADKVFKVELARNLNERPFIFRENLNFDTLSRVNLQYSHKIVDTWVDTNFCSNRLISDMPQGDSQNRLKLSYLFNTANLAKNDLCRFKVGSTLVNSANSLYLKNKLSLRKFFFTSPFTYQLNLEIGNVTNLKGPNDALKIHEKLYVQNFRGIISPSRKAQVKEGVTGDSLGNTNYLMVMNKILLNNIPVFNNFSLKEDGFTVNPFVHFNLLLNPTFIKEEEKEYNPLHLSAGFGISFIHQAIAVEIYYNAYVKKNHMDVGREFSIRFGLD